MRKNIPTLLFGLILFAFPAADAFAQQYARPDSTVTTGNFSAVGAATLHDAVNEVTVNDSDYMESPTSNSTVELGLSNVTDPNSGSGHIMRVRILKTHNASSAELQLYQGTTQIATSGSVTPSSRNIFQTFTYNLTTGEADSISNYSDLRIRVVTSGVRNGRLIRVSWMELEVSNPAAATAPTVTSPTVAAVTAISADLGGNVTDDGGAAITARGTVWNATGAPITENSLAEGGATTGIFSHTRSSLTSATQIFYRAYATNSEGTSYSPDDSFYTEPANSPVSVSIDTVTSDSFRVFWPAPPAGDGDGAIIVISTSPVAATPTDGVEHAFDSVFGSGADLGGGQFVVYRGNATQVTVTGLSPSTTYHVAAFYFAGSGAGTQGINYRQNTPATNSQATDAAAAVPVLDASTFSNVGATTATLGGNITDDGGTALTERGTVWNTTGSPITQNQLAEGGTATGSFSHGRTGLNSGSIIWFRSYAVNATGAGYGPDVSFYTEPANSPASVSIDSVSAGSFRVFWPAPPAGDGDGAIVVVREATAVTATPTDGVEHAASATFGSGADLGTQEYVVYRGSATEVTVSGLAAETTYHVAVFYSAGTGTGASGINYRQTTPATNNATTTVATGNEPTVQASNIVVDVVASRSMRIQWTPGNGDGSIVTMRLQATSASPPVDFTDYTADRDYSLAPETSGGSQNFVVYKSTGSSVTVSGLASNTTYTIAVYAWGGFGVETDYLQANPPELDQTTDGPAMHNYDNAADCVDCHNNHGNTGLVPRGANQEAVCKTCHNATGPASGKLDFALHLTPAYGDVDPDCGSCHEVHRIRAGSANTTESTNPVTSVTDHNITFIRANVDKYISTATPDDAVYHTAGDDLAIEGGDATTSRGICQSCHTLTSYHKHNSAEVNSQCHRGGASDTCDASEVDCTSCHTHVDNFAPSGGSCTGCHSSAQAGGPPTGRRAIVGEFSLLSHHVAGTLADSDCEVCHSQSGAGAITHAHQDGFITLWNVDDHSANAFQLGDHADPFETTAQASILTQFCLNCHDSNGAADITSPTSKVTDPLSPFSGSGAPPVIDQTHWTNSSHNTGGAASPVTCFGNGGNGCHASGHGSEKQWLLAPYTVPATDPDRSEEREDFCFTCHSSGGMSTLDIQADFAGAAITETSASGAKISNRHDVMPIDQAYSGGLVTCKNCHQQHQNTNADPVADPDDDSFLPDYDKSSSYTKDGHNLVYDAGGNLDPVNPEGASGGPYTELDYIQFCLTCHDGTTPPGVTMSPNMVNLATAYTGDDKHGAVEGSTGSKTGKGALKVPWVNSTNDGNDDDPDSPYAALNCTTCHGAHGTGSIFNLKSEITVAGQVMTVGGKGNMDEAAYFGNSTYTLPLIGGSQTDHYWGAWCTFCHKMDSHPGKVEADSCTGGHMHGGGAF